MVLFEVKTNIFIKFFPFHHGGILHEIAQDSVLHSAKNIVLPSVVQLNSTVWQGMGLYECIVSGFFVFLGDLRQTHP